MIIIKPYQTILVPVDGSENSQSALAHAIYLAKQCNAALHLLHVVNLAAALSLSGYDQGHYSLLKEVQSALTETGNKVLNEAAAKIPAPVKHSVSLEMGAPGQIIIDCADKCKAHLIVMGSRGLGPVKGLFMGSVSNHVMGQSPIPVLIVK